MKNSDRAGLQDSGTDTSKDERITNRNDQIAGAIEVAT